MRARGHLPPAAAPTPPRTAGGRDPLTALYLLIRLTYELGGSG